MMLDVVKLARAAVEAVGKERRLVAGPSRRRQNDVSAGRDSGLLGDGRYWLFWVL